jgi:DNA gyrase subunit A
LKVDDATLPLMGRTAQGTLLMRLLPGEAVVGAVGLPGDGSVLLATTSGQLKHLAVAELRQCQRGDLGQIGLRFQQRGDALVALCDAAINLVAAVVSGGQRSARIHPQTLSGSDEGLLLELQTSERLEDLVPLINDP